VRPSSHPAYPARFRQSLTADTSTLPARRTRFAIALGAAIAAALYVWAYARANPDFVSDFDQVWAAAHVDEDWNIEKWGVDEEVASRRLARYVDFQAATRIFDAMKA